MRLVLDAERVAGIVSGPTDIDFEAQWLMDARHAFPAKATGGISSSVTPDASYTLVDVLAAVNHAIPAGGSVALGGAIGQSIVIPPYGADGIARNGVKLLTSPVTVNSSFTVTAPPDASGAAVIGELWVGKSHVLENVQAAGRMDFLMGRQFDPGKPFKWETSLPPYDPGESEQRRWRGSVILTNTGFDELESWYTSTRQGKRPTLFMMKDTSTEAVLAQWEYSDTYNERLHFVTIEILEFPRTSW